MPQRVIPGIPPGGPERPCWCRAGQLRHLRQTVMDIVRGQLSPGDALYLEYRRDRYLRYLLRRQAG